MAGFSLARLRGLQLPEAMRALDAFEKAREHLQEASAQFVHLIGKQRFRDNPVFDDVSERNRLRTLLRRVRRFAEQAQSNDAGSPAEIPEEAIAQVRAALPDIADALHSLLLAARETQTAHQHWTRTFEHDSRRAREVLRRLFSDDEALREAVFLESVEAFQRIEQLIGEPEARGSRRRQRERLAVLYAQRFFSKNDTNSLCGPHSLLSIDLGAERDFVSMRTGIETRRTYFSHWAAELVLHALAQRTGNELPLRLNPTLRADEEFVSWCTMEHDATQFFRRRYARTRTNPELSALLTTLSNPSLSSTSDVDLSDLREANILCAPSLPVGVFDPLESVQATVDGWPSSARDSAHTSIAEFRSYVEAFSQSALPSRVELMAQLESSFSTLTGQSSLRGAGQHYADRSLLHEDCHVQASVGLSVHSRVGLENALSAIVSAASLPMELWRARVRHWFSQRFGDGKRIHALEVHRAFDEEGVVRNPPSCPEADAVTLAMTRVRDLIGKAADSARGGVAMLSPQRLADAARVAGRKFRASYASADLMFLNPNGPESTLFILSEMHGIYMLPTCLFDVAPPAVRDDALKRMRTVLQRLAGGRRTVEPLFTHTQATDRRFPVADGDLSFIGYSNRPQSCSFGELDMVLDGDIRFLQGNEEVVPTTVYQSSRFLQYTSPLAPFIDDYAGKFFPTELLPDTVRRHGPRMVVGNVIMRRASRQQLAGEVTASLSTDDEPTLFLKAQRLCSQLALGRTVFASVPGQPKPVYIDFDSFSLVEAFARLAERATAAEPVTFSEMLPNGSELFLEGADGYRTFELRVGLYRDPPAG